VRWNYQNEAFCFFFPGVFLGDLSKDSRVKTDAMTSRTASLVTVVFRLAVFNVILLMLTQFTLFERKEKSQQTDVL